MIGHEYKVSSLDELCQVIKKISDVRKHQPGYPLWFRGHDNASYTLLPTLLRMDKSKDTINRYETYDTTNLQEDYRLQNFKARVFHLTNPRPSNRIEWLALYQHHRGRTRLLDWSESVWTALSFALEVYLDAQNRSDLNLMRSTVTPTIWVLDPIALNQKVYEYFVSGTRADLMIKKAVRSIEDQKNRLFRQIKKSLVDEEPYHRGCRGGEFHIAAAGIMNLGVIDEFRQHHMEEMRGMLLSGEYHPFFYLCLRYFADGLPVPVDYAGEEILPPLAVLHQYQSERIRSQRGTFTVFPNYFLRGDAQENCRLGYDCRKMEKQPAVKDCLYKIRLLNPRKVAAELMMAGGRQTELYPESDCFTRIMEAEKYFI